jgi:SNF2 family DNA or RNA helicase
MNELATRVTPANNLRDLEAFEDGTNEDLFPHQKAGVKFLTAARRALLADEPGLGKTAQAIRALAELQKNGEDVFPALVVCPNTLKKNWKREFAKWWPGVEVEVIRGSSTQRRKQFETPAHVYVINWESLRSHSKLASYGSIALARCRECGGQDEKVSENRCEVHKRELNNMDFKAVIADEIHRSKDPKSKQTRALWAATGDADIRFALTGTPIANDVLDLWSILHWLSPEEWPSKTRWVDRMVNTMLNAFGGMMVLGVKPHMEKEFYDAINPRMRRMLKKIVLPWLPDMMFERRDIEMSTKQKKAYDQMRDLMIAELEGGEAITAPSPLTQTIRLLQFASSFAEINVDETTGETRVRLAEPSCKVDALMNDIENKDFGDDSVAVCAVSRQLIELLSAEMTKAKIPHGLITGAQTEDERQQAVDDFQSGKIKWILFTAQAGGVGITLTAARRLVMLQRPWSLVDHKQALDRVHRIGSEIHDSVIITDYVTEGTIEERVLQVLETKADNFEQIVRDKTALLALLKDDKAGNL